MQELDGEGLDLRVWATPVEIGGEELTVFAVSDIAHEKRRSALERIFFHDVLNTAGGLRGYVELLGETEPDEVAEVVGIVRGLTEKLIEEINAQKALAAAEGNDLVTQPAPINAAEFLREIAQSYSNHEAATDRGLEVKSGPDIVFASDRNLLGRVVGNMVKNALEASEVGDTVRIAVDHTPDTVIFRVWNAQAIPQDVALRVFQRNFSTKHESGRGLGTYSMKLLGEKILGGKVEFTTSEKGGTTFRLSLPVRPAPIQR